jgi:hypothetical protein
MLVDTISEHGEASLASSASADRWLGLRCRSGWFLGKFLLTLLLLTYLIGWVQDFQRIRRLRAEPTPPYKIITKYEAWGRIHRRLTRIPLRPSPALARQPESFAGASAGLAAHPAPPSADSGESGPLSAISGTDDPHS